MIRRSPLLAAAAVAVLFSTTANAFSTPTTTNPSTPLTKSSTTPSAQSTTTTTTLFATSPSSSRRSFLTSSGLAFCLVSSLSSPSPARAVGPVKVDLLNPKYSAKPCPPSKPIPGQMAMKGMRGLCVTVNADLREAPPKDLDKVGVYGFVTDAATSESVLANNPDGGTDAGQFAIIEKVATTDTKVEFEFVAAVPKEKDISQFENGIGDLSFESLRVISFPGGQQYGAINPCEMNEFSDECEAWEQENGEYERGNFMVKSNPRTKGR